MLIVTRKTNESITIEPLADVDPGMTLGEAFQNGPIEIKLVRINRSRVRIAIDAPPEFHVWRGKQQGPSAAVVSSSQHYEPAGISVEYSIASDL